MAEMLLRNQRIRANEVALNTSSRIRATDTKISPNEVAQLLMQNGSAFKFNIHVMAGV